MQRVLVILLCCYSFVCAQVHYIKEPTFNQVTFVKTYGNPQNEAIVFVHGLGDEGAQLWEESALALEDDYFILMFDLPGFGRSDKANKLYSPRNYAYFINYLAQHFIQKPFHLVGHSMGAAISLKYASMFADIKSLMLIDAAGILNKVAYSQFILKEKTEKMTENEGIVDFVQGLPKALNSILPLDLSPALQNNTSRKLLFRSNPSTIAATALVETDYSNVPQNIDVNTLIMWGDEDKVAPIRTGYVLHKLIPNSKFISVENAGHVPIKDAPQLFLKTLQEHLLHHAYAKQLPVYDVVENERIIEGENGVTITGNIKNLVIKSSTNIRIKDAKIEHLIIDNSSVDILNSQLLLKSKVKVLNSTLTVTATDLETSGIETLNSNIDFAGVVITTSTYLFKNLSTQKAQNVLFSLCTLNQNTLHELVSVKRGETF